MAHPTRPQLSDLVALALEAGAVIMEVYGRGEIAVTIKPDASPVTEADLAAEALILARLAADYPHIPVVAEEAAAAGRVPECGSLFFLVDPLDGSKEFIKRNGEFTVNIALVEDGVPVAGVVHAPALGRIWWGGRGEGSFAAEVDGRVDMARLGEVTPIAVRPAPREGLTLVGSRSHGGEPDAAWLAAYRVSQYSAIGSSLKFCLVAEGKADLYPRFGRTMEWDTAAGDAILRAAGGMVVDAQRQALCYGKRQPAGDSDFVNPHFWALGGELDLLVEK